LSGNELSNLRLSGGVTSEIIAGNQRPVDGNKGFKVEKESYKS